MDVNKIKWLQDNHVFGVYIKESPSEGKKRKTPLEHFNDSTTFSKSQHKVMGKMIFTKTKVNVIIIENGEL